MATIRISGGNRGARLADLITAACPGSQWQRVRESIEVKGPRLEVRASMVAQAYWPDSPANPSGAERFLRRLVAYDPRTLQLATPDCLVVADGPESEQPLLVRFPATLKERLARLAEALGTSQNDLVLRAVQDLLSFAEELERDEPAHH